MAEARVCCRAYRAVWPLGRHPQNVKTAIRNQFTPKQARFVTEYLADGCASDAYRAAYNARDMSDGAIQVEASRLLDNPKVAAAIDEHRAALAKKARHSLQDCIADQERAMELAEASGNASAYAQAAMNKAKLLGHVTDRAEVRTGQLDPEEAKPDMSSI